MTLRDFLSVMSLNSDVMVTLLNVEEKTELITFNIAGYLSVESDVLDRKVKRCDIKKSPSTTALKVVLFDAEVDPGTNG